MSNSFNKFDQGIRLEPQISEPASGLDGEFYFNETLQQYRGWKNGAWGTLGSGGFGVSFIQNGDGESSTTGWASYNDGASSVPVDGTGGSATALTFAVTRNPALVLYQLGSFDLTKSAVNAEGQGVSYDFTIDQGYRGYSMMIQCIYKGSANFGYGAGTSVSPSDVSVFMYNVDTAQLVPMSTNYLDGSGSFLATFNADSISANYRLIFHVATSNALAWDFYFDSVLVGPVQVVRGSVETDWINAGVNTITATISNPTKGTTTTDKLWYRRVGGNAEIRIEFVMSGAGTAGSGDYLFAIPSFLPIDLTKLTAYTGSDQKLSSNAVGIATAGQPGTDAGVGPVTVYDATHVRISLRNAATPNFNFAGSSFFPLSVAENFIASFSVPIAGWSSNMILSSETSTQKSMMRAYKNAGSISANTVIPSWTTIQIDTTNNFNSTSGIYTVNAIGDYHVEATLHTTDTTAGNDDTVSVYVNNILYASGITGNGEQGASLISTVIPNLKPNDTIDIRCSNNRTITSDNTGTYLSIYKIATPQTIAFDGNKIATIKDLKTSGTDGGSNTGGTTATRTLNTLNDPYGIISLNSNQINLQPGRYKISARAPAYNVTRHQIQLYNITSSSVQIVGSNASSGGTDNTSTDSLFEDIVIIGVPTTFEIRHYTQSSQSTTGFGIASSSGQSEIYTTVTIEKIA